MSKCRSCHPQIALQSARERQSAELSAGDIFTCVGIQKGRPMCIENLVRGNSDMSYVIGSKNGLTSLEIIEAE